MLVVSCLFIVLAIALKESRVGEQRISSIPYSLLLVCLFFIFYRLGKSKITFTQAIDINILNNP